MYMIAQLQAQFFVKLPQKIIPEVVILSEAERSRRIYAFDSGCPTCVLFTGGLALNERNLVPHVREANVGISGG
jgi:hypothetical protein